MSDIHRTMHEASLRRHSEEKIASLEQQIFDREQGRQALVKTLCEIAEATTYDQAVSLAREHLDRIGVAWWAKAHNQRLKEVAAHASTEIAVPTREDIRMLRRQRYRKG